MIKKITITIVLLLCFTFIISSQPKIDRIDMEKVRETWLMWYNNVRAELDLPPYEYNELLDKTALEWSQTALERNLIVHKRDLSDDAYYNYKVIKSWFSDRGVNFKNIKGYTFTENIGYGYFRCKSYDCTVSLIKAIESTFKFFMSEKNLKERSQRAHYESIINSQFKLIGLGIVIDEANNGYYLTVHYATDVY